MGSANAAVFPVPVAAWARRSRLASINGIVSRWTGVGSSYPRAVSVATSGSASPSAEKPLFAGAIQRLCHASHRGAFEVLRHAFEVFLTARTRRHRFHATCTVLAGNPRAHEFRARLHSPFLRRTTNRRSNAIECRRPAGSHRRDPAAACAPRCARSHPYRNRVGFHGRGGTWRDADAPL